MALQNSDFESTEQLLEAQTHVWDHALAFIHSMSLNCTIQLGIPDILHSHGSPMTLSQIVEALSIDKAKSHCIHRLLRLLVHSKFLSKICTKGGDDHYWLTPASRLLLRDAPSTLAPNLRFVLDPVLINSWHWMTEWLVNGNPNGSAFEIANGRNIWEHMRHDSRLNKLFNESMARETRILMSTVVRDQRQMFEGIGLLVDVGGGVGTAAKAILEALPGMNCVVLDLPHVVAGLEGTDNLTFVGGDMFRSVPQADAVLLKCILHDWNDADCVRILKKCKEAIMPREGKVMIIEVVLKEDWEGEDEKKVVEEVQLLFDMSMMNCQNGKERSKREWIKVFRDAGFSSYKFTPVLDVGFNIIENLPRAFSDKLKQENISEQAVIESPKGTWEVQVCKEEEGGMISFTNGWPNFVDRHGLSIGDFVVFEHIGNFHFNVVFMFDMSACQKELPIDPKEAPKNTTRQEKLSSGVSSQTKNPSFTLTMQCYHVTRSGFVYIPAEFWRSNHLENKTDAVLRDPRGREWTVKLNLRMLKGRRTHRLTMGRGWREFSVRNKLKVGDRCVFYLSRNSIRSGDVEMDVQILPKARPI